MTEAVQQAIYRLSMDSSQYTAGAAKATASSAALVNSMEGVEVVTAKVGNEFERQLARQNPLLAIELKRKNAIEALTRAGQEENVGLIRLNSAIEQTNSRFDQQIAKLTQLRSVAANQNALNSAVTGSTRAMGFAVQNAAFQFGDLAVQIASGQGVIRPLIQQGSQLLQVFGTWGAILGAAGAALGAVVVGMGLFNESAEDQKKATDAAAEATKALAAEQKLLKESLGAVDDAIIKNIGSLSIYLSKAQDTVGASLATQGSRLRDMIAERDEQRANLDVLLLRDFDSPSRAKMEREMAADIAKKQREIDTQSTVVQGLAGQAVRLGKIVPTWGMETTGTTDAPDKSIQTQIDQRERARQSIEDQIDALSREEKQIRMTARERAVDVELQRAEMTARNGNIQLTDVQIEALTVEARRKFNSAEASKAIVEAEKERLEAEKDAAREREKAEKDYQRQLERTADVIGDQVNSLAQAALGWEDWRDVAKQAINVVINELSKMSSLGGSGGGIFDLLLGIGTSALGAAAGGIGGGSIIGGPGFGTARADGGPVMAGGHYTVGERGTEDLYMSPRGGGYVVPRGGQAAGGGTVVVNQNFDFRNASVNQAMIRSEVAKTVPQTVAAVRADISDQKRRGGLPAFR